MHWSLLFAKRKVCIEAQGCICTDELSEPSLLSCLAPGGAFQGNTVVTDINVVDLGHIGALTLLEL